MLSVGRVSAVSCGIINHSIDQEGSSPQMFLRSLYRFFVRSCKHGHSYGRAVGQAYLRLWTLSAKPMDSHNYLQTQLMVVEQTDKQIHLQPDQTPDQLLQMRC